MPHSRVSVSLKAELSEACTGVSYEGATLQASRHNSELKLSKQTVASCVRKFKTKAAPLPQEKRRVSVLYIEADEDHISLKNGKNKDTRLIYIHEGVVDKPRRHLKNARYFTTINKDPEEFWLEVCDYIEGHYEFSSIEKIYLSGDGASWIRVGEQYIPGVTFILDKFHLSKYIIKATAHAPELRKLIYKGIWKLNKQAVLNHLQEALSRAEELSRKKRIRDTIRYINNNWDGIESQVKHPHVGCSAEGHVSHILAARLSSRPMAWSLQGAENMAAMRAVKANGESVSEHYLAMKKPSNVIVELKQEIQKERFISLIHLINEETLINCHKEMSSKKASGVDEVTKAEYDEGLEENVGDLIARMKRQAYKPQPARRVYIPKAGTNKKRPLGIPAYEDKLVQSTLAEILNAIYEQDFLECSFGYRPNRGCHDALKLLDKIVNKESIRYVVDTDIAGFFDNVDHEWMMRFIEHRIADRNLIRLIARMLKAGVIDAGIKYETPQGTPQGGSASPIFANIYLHYVIDLWFDKIVRKHCRGEAYMVRYADDGVFCFQYEEDAKRFYEALIKRLGKFNLKIAEEKTKIIELKKYDKDDKDGNGDDKGENSFDFLGFTHYVGKDRNGRKRVKRKTSKKKYKASLLRCKEWMKRNRIMPIREFMEIIKAKIRGHCRYYGVTDNREAVSNFIDECKRLLFKWLNRRSQRKSFDWSKFNIFLEKYPLPRARTYVRIFDVGAGNSYLR